MKPYFIIGCFITLFFNCKEATKQIPMDAAYVDALNQNREIRAENRLKYLELTGLFKLDYNSNTFGKAASNNFVLAIENLAESIGSIDLSKEALTFYAAKDIKVTNAQNEEIETLALEIDAYGNSIQLFHKQLKWQVITRSGALYLRVWDLKNPAIQAFKGFENYEINSDYIFEADFNYFETAHLESVNSKLGLPDVTDFIGQLHFMYKGEPYSLDVGSEGFVMVRDLTSGETTYGGGRYMYLELPETNGSVTLDFNYLFNPPCAYSEFTTCLFPPRQNQLAFSVKAGELMEEAL
ncbi:DUF1684 domain-containing protein [Flavobacteriaceae bacterium]|nr:DUF1684 domain-containing protein [Flavobacteriaceae bacterium]